MCRRTLTSLSLVAVTIALVGPALVAATKTANGITLTFPDYPLTGPGLASCEPWSGPASSISLTGVPEGATVNITFGWFNPQDPTTLVNQPTVQYDNVTGGTLLVAVPYPSDTSAWPGFNPATNERSIGVAVFTHISSGGTITKLSAQWWVRCLPPPTVFGGCTPGFWRNHTSQWPVYSPTDDFEAVFGVDASFDPHTLFDAVWLGGGGERALARHAVAALLNSVSSEFTYAYTTAQIIAGVQNAYATGDFNTFMTQLDAANNAGCPF